MTGSIRPKAVCVCRRGDRVLVAPAFDTVKRQTYYCPPGGGIEFGEHAADAVRREMREELAVELSDVSLLGVLENVFTHEGVAGHEVVFVFAATLENPAFYERDEIAGVESNGRPFVVQWLPLADFRPGGALLHPHGLFDLLRPRDG